RNEIIDSEISAEVLAAAEIVSVLLGKPGINVPNSLAKWLIKKKNYDRGLVNLFNKIINSEGIVSDETRSAWNTFSKEEKWVDVLESLSDIAVSNIELIIDKSELKELWQSSDSYEEWIKEVNDLKFRCLIQKNS
ncbi:DUF4259 domain-containing protein, partial [Paenibacillus sp. MCAF20]